MAVKIRLTRKGRKDAPVYNIVATDSRVSRDGKFIKKLGLYNPRTNPSTVEINREDTLLYLLNGAQTTFTVRRLLSDAGIMIKKHLQVGVIKGKISQQEADKKFDEWRKDKEHRVGKPLPGFAVTKAEDKKIDVKKKETKTPSDKLSANKEDKIEPKEQKVEKEDKVEKINKAVKKSEAVKADTVKNIKEEKITKTEATKSTKEEKPVSEKVKTVKADIASKKKEETSEDKSEKNENENEIKKEKEKDKKGTELKKEKVEVKKEVAKKPAKAPETKKKSEDKEKAPATKSSMDKKNEK